MAPSIGRSCPSGGLSPAVATRVRASERSARASPTATRNSVDTGSRNASPRVSVSNSPTVPDRPRARARALGSGPPYPSSVAVSRIVARSVCESLCGRLKALETVIRLTPTASATSWSVTFATMPPRPTITSGPAPGGLHRSCRAVADVLHAVRLTRLDPPGQAVERCPRLTAQDRGPPRGVGNDGCAGQGAGAGAVGQVANEGAEQWFHGSSLLVYRYTTHIGYTGQPRRTRNSSGHAAQWRPGHPRVVREGGAGLPRVDGATTGRIRRGPRCGPARLRAHHVRSEHVIPSPMGQAPEGPRVPHRRRRRRGGPPARRGAGPGRSDGSARAGGRSGDAGGRLRRRLPVGSPGRRAPGAALRDDASGVPPEPLRARRVRLHLGQCGRRGRPRSGLDRARRGD